MILFLSLCFAEEFDKEIEVFGNSNYVIYVGKPNIISKPNNLKIRDTIFFEYASAYKGLIQEKGLYGYYSIEDKIEIYNSETVSLEYEDCNFELKPKKCSYDNDMWYLEPTITFNENQIVTSLVMYDSSMQPIAQSSHTSNLIVEYKEKKKKSSSSSVRVGSGACQSMPYQGVNISCSRTKKEEELDDQEKIFKPKFIETNVRQASLYLMSSIRIK